MLLWHCLASRQGFSLSKRWLPASPCPASSPAEPDEPAATPRDPMGTSVVTPGWVPALGAAPCQCWTLPWIVLGFPFASGW